MKGTKEIKIRSKKINYDFIVKRKITIIQGDSSTGKTTLARLISEIENTGAGQVVSSVPCYAFTGNIPEWEYVLGNLSDSVVVLDEDCSFMASLNFSKLVKNSSCYFILITREPLKNLTYSMDEIYKIRNSGRYNYLENVYTIEESNTTPARVLCEDFGSGFKFFQEVLGAESKVDSSKGNSNIVSSLEEMKGPYIYIVLDRAAFGSYSRDLYNYITSNKERKYIISPFESFEHMLLSSEMFYKYCREKVDNPQDYMANEFLSWEQYYTNLLKDLTQEDSSLSYSKSTLRYCYYKNCCHKNNAVPCKYKVSGDKLKVLVPWKDIGNIPKLSNFS